ncbi:MAG: hypothetical protein ACT4P6_23265 [Gemmatimonadaceae bacterium]
MNGTTPDSVLRVADAVLARDSLSIVAAVVRARSLADSSAALRRGGMCCTCGG